MTFPRWCMGLFTRWFGTRPSGELEERVARFRAAVRAADLSDEAGVQALSSLQADLGLEDEDVELELEMRDAARAVNSLRDSMTREGVPVLDTTHRVLGSDVCHFAAPASAVASDGDQSGKVFLTNRRVVFLSVAAKPLPWSSIASIFEEERDVVFVTVMRQAWRFRFNSFTDAKYAAEIAAHLLKK